MRHKETLHTDTTIATWAHAIWQALRAYGCDPAPLFQEAGLDTSRLSDPMHRYPVTNMTALWELSVNATGDRYFALAVAKEINPTTFFAVGLSALTSSNSKQAIDILLEYSQLISDSIVFDFRKGKNWELIVNIKPGHECFHPICFEAIWAAMIYFSRHYLQWDLHPEKITFKHKAPADIKPFEDFFVCKVEFECDECALITPADKFNQILSTANPTLFMGNEVILRDYNERYQQQHFSHKIRDVLIKEMENPFPKQRDIALLLGISESKLQKKLFNEGVRYKDIVDEVREKLARQWLTEKHKNISQIAWGLGFSEVSSFTRAFKRWTGKTPSTFSQNIE